MINKTRWFENVSFLFNPQYLREIFIKARNQDRAVLMGLRPLHRSTEAAPSFWLFASEHQSEWIY